MPEETQLPSAFPSHREQSPHGTPSFPVEIFELSIPESTIPWHWHEDWEYVLCTRNRVKCSTAQGEIVLDPGYGAFLGPRVIHEITAEDGTCGIRSLVFHPHFLGNEGSLIWQKYVAPVQECGAIKLCPDIPWQWDCMHFFCVAWHAMDQRGPGYEIETRQALENAVYRLSLQAELRESSLSEKVRRNTQRLEQMLQFIRQNYGEELTVSQIADSAAISESECLRCFRSCLHTSPSRYLRDFRLQKAETLLLSTQGTSANIGAACGFSDAAYFTKLFREVKGCTPLEYRKRRGSRQP